MKNFISSTYAFARDGEGNGPDETGVRREIRDTFGMLGIGAGAASFTGADQRALNAVWAGAFTADQFARACALIAQAIRERRERMNTMKAEGLASFQKDYAEGVLKQTDQVERRWLEAVADVRRLIASAAEVRVTGLEPNADERRAVARETVKSSEGKVT